MEAEQYVLEEGQPLCLHLLTPLEHLRHVLDVARVVRRDLREGRLVLFTVFGHFFPTF